MKMTKEELLKRIDLAKKLHAKQCEKNALSLKRRARGDSREYYLARAVDALTAKFRTGLPWKSRKLVFESTNGFLDPLTMHGTSYRWWHMVKVINGKVTLNSYHYSQQTAGHISDARCTLKLLGVKFVEIDAPAGLQNLERARDHYLETLAAREIDEKYARKKYPQGLRAMRARTTRALAFLAKAGVKIAKDAKVKALEAAEANRAEKNANARERSAAKRARAAIQVHMDPHGYRSGEQGLHINVDEFSNGGHEVPYYVKERAIEDALTKGFTQTFFHLEAVKAPSFEAIVPILATVLPFRARTGGAS